MASSSTATSIIVLNAALDNFEGKAVLRGVIALDSLPLLKVDGYQREKLAPSARANIMKALETKERLPDIELGMRGENFDPSNPESVSLLDPVYIIDGLQRRETVLEFLEKNPDAKPRIGALIHFNTTREWEKDRFYVLNKHRITVSPNVHLRNMRDESAVLGVLWGLTGNDRNFVLHQRVQWNQNMSRGELLSAVTLVKVVGMLHSHKVPGRTSGVTDLLAALDSNIEKVGSQIIRENLRIFFSLVDECWGIRKVHFRTSTSYLKAGFLWVLAKSLSNHHDFWRQPDEKRLFVEAPLRRKLASFPVDDPEVVRMAGSGGKAREHLYLMLVDHINSGKRTKKLSSRHPTTIELEEDESEQTDAEEEAA